MHLPFSVTQWPICFSCWGVIHLVPIPIVNKTIKQICRNHFDFKTFISDYLVPIPIVGKTIKQKYPGIILNSKLLLMINWYLFQL